MAKVLNKHMDVIPKDAVYIGRGSKWGNPFVINTNQNRNDVCEKHKAYIDKKIRNKEITAEEMVVLYRKDLVCYCAPRRCHGDHLMKLAEQAYYYLHPAIEK